MAERKDWRNRNENWLEEANDEYLEYLEESRLSPSRVVSHEEFEEAVRREEFTAAMQNNADDWDAWWGAMTLIRQCAELANEELTDEQIDEGGRAIMNLFHLPRSVRRVMLTRAREVILLDPQNWDDPRTL